MSGSLLNKNTVLYNNEFNKRTFQSFHQIDYVHRKNPMYVYIQLYSLRQEETL